MTLLFLLLKNFIRTKQFVALCIASTFLGVAQMILGLLPIIWDATGSAFHFLLIMTLPLVGLLNWITFAIISYEFSKQVFGEGRDSLFRLKPHGHIKVVFLFLVLIMLFCAIAPLISVAIVAVFANAVNFTGSAYMNALSAVCLWVGGPTLTAALLGTLLGRVTSRPIGYSLIAGLFIFVTPLMNNIISGRISLETTSHSLQTLLYWILIAPFELGAPFITVIPDSILLLPNGLHRWLLPLVWTLSALIGLVFSLRKDKRFSLGAFGLSFVVLIAAWSAYGNHIAQPRFSDVLPTDIQDTSLMSTLFDDSVSGTLSLHQTENIPAVAEYTIDIDIRNVLYGRVSMLLAEPFLETPKFTLFRGYNISGIADLDGNELEFSQEGNLITILTPNQEQTMGFHFEYSGSGWGNYANYQGVFLPGTFPWYPWPGKQRFYWECDMHSVGVSRHIVRRGDVETIRVRTSSTFAEIFTPQGIVLTSGDTHAYIPADAVTLMAGQVSRVGDDETLFFYGGETDLMWYDIPGDYWNINDIRVRERILTEAYTLRVKMGLADVEMQTQAFVLVPTFPAYSNLYVFPVNQGKYILVAANNVTDFVTALAFQDIPQGYEKRELYEVVYRYLSDPEDHFFLNPGQGKLVTEDGFPTSRIGNLFTDLVLEHDEELVVRHVVKYLIDEDMVVGSEEFLLMLMDDLNDSN